MLSVVQIIITYVLVAESWMHWSFYLHISQAAVWCLHLPESFDFGETFLKLARNLHT